MFFKTYISILLFIRLPVHALKEAGDAGLCTVLVVNHRAAAAMASEAKHTKPIWARKPGEREEVGK
jgi:hypothetical protein